MKVCIFKTSFNLLIYLLSMREGGAISKIRDECRNAIYLTTIAGNSVSSRLRQYIYAEKFNLQIPK